MCKYSKDISDVLVKALWCELCNDYCGRCRYCKQKNKMVMTSGYIKDGCNIKNEFENNQKGGV